MWPISKIIISNRVLQRREKNTSSEFLRKMRLGSLKL